jgi:methionine-rich copper-binding protein CopC
MPRGSGCGALVSALLLLSAAAALARPMHLMNSTPAAHAIIQGRNAQYIVRFDGPIDHERSRLEIMHNGQVIESLHPLLNSAVDVLAASAPALQPGRYQLHWLVRSVDGRSTSEGMIPFAVAQ